MKTKALQMIETQRMLQPGDRVCAALSGGADSVALLAFLRSIAEEYGLELSACHLNHCLRGEESQRDEAFVRSLCQSWGIPLTVERQPVAELAAKSGDSLELAGRKARYALFARLHAQQGCKVATAHTLSDQIETVLQRLVRGTGVTGLCGISPVRRWIIRPLLGCTRQEIEEYCTQQGLTFVQDSSNFTTQYTRNRLRWQVVPQLYGINPALHTAIAQMCSAMTECRDYLRQQAEAFLRLHRTQKGVPSAGLLQLHPALRREVLAEMAREAGAELSARHTEICQALVDTGGAVQLGAGVTFRVRQGWCSMVRQRPERHTDPFCFALGTIGEIMAAGRVQQCLPDGRCLTLRVLDYEQMKNFSKQSEIDLKNALACAKIDGNVVLRTRQAGDALYFAARNVTKRLKKLFQEAGIPARQRDEIPLLADDTGVLWVEGFGPHGRVELSADQRHATILMIEIERICGYDKNDGPGYGEDFDY